ncbi:MAG: MarR family winged helix-turn-helix transcriptional regulator [Rhodomicrobiaceae bacterium]
MADEGKLLEHNGNISFFDASASTIDATAFINMQSHLFRQVKCICIYRVNLDANASMCQIWRMTNQPDETILRSWIALMRAHHAALGTVENALKNAGLPQLGWYDVLLEVERAGKGGLRPFELERKLLLPQYGLSRLLERIAAAGYIERRPCGDDRRGQLVVITRAGAKMRSRMWPVYAEAVEAAIGLHLTSDEAATLARLLRKLY